MPAASGAPSAAAALGTPSARRRLAALRQPARTARLARALWIVWAIVVWNVVFDHVIVSAGRQYIVAAELAISGRGSAAPHFENMDDWMRPAVWRALWTATASASAILAVGLCTIHLATRAPQGSQVTSCALRLTR
jgi:hypothetical protein